MAGKLAALKQYPPLKFASPAIIVHYAMAAIVKTIRPLRSEQSMFRFTTTEQVLFECEARVHLLYVKRLQLISECSSGRELLCGTFLSAQESSICHCNIKKNEHYKFLCWAESPTY